jgi:REP element-mobilizing transposase RayT
MRARQLSFADINKTSKTEELSQRKRHGHDIRKGRRKLSRPIDPRKPLHLVFRAERAKGAWSLRRFKHIEHIKKLTYFLAKRNQIKIIEYANGGNHLHLFILAKDRNGFKKFTRTLTGLVARLVTGAKKGNAVGKFWDTLFFSRVVEWGRDYFATKDYVIQNEREASGEIPYTPRIKWTLRP